MEKLLLTQLLFLLLIPLIHSQRSSQLDELRRLGLGNVVNVPFFSDGEGLFKSWKYSSTYMCSNIISVFMPESSMLLVLENL